MESEAIDMWQASLSAATKAANAEIERGNKRFMLDRGDVIEAVVLRAACRRARRLTQSSTTLDVAFALIQKEAKESTAPMKEALLRLCRPIPDFATRQASKPPGRPSNDFTGVVLGDSKVLGPDENTSCLWDLLCPCGEKYKRTSTQIRHRISTNARSFCSKQCSGKFVKSRK